MPAMPNPTTARPSYHDDPTADAIQVTQWPDSTGGASANGPDGLFGHLLDAYEQRGYVAGYRRAASDVLTTLLATSEEFIRQRRPASAADLRRVVLAFADCLEKRVAQATGPESGLVEGGLGI